MVTRSSSKAAAALSLVAICGTIAFFSIPSINNSHHEHSSPSVVVDESPPASLRSSSITDTNNNQLESTHRRLSNALPDGGCELTWPVKPRPGIPITYAASYPGCGARMTWNLVEALTGLWTGDDWNNNGRGDEVVTVKTHFPQSNGILPEFDDRIKRAFIMIRNPMKSIPSFFNHIHEMRNHLPVHSERAPLEEWIKWRNAYLDTEILEYKKFICYWMDRYTPENRLMMTYEGITDELIGPEVAKGLNEFLGQAQGVTTIDSESVPCVWRAVVKNKPPEAQAAHIAKLQSLALNQPQNQQIVEQAPVPVGTQPQQITEQAPVGTQNGQAPEGYGTQPIIEQAPVGTQYGQAPESYGTQPIIEQAPAGTQQGQAPEGYGTQPIIQQAPESYGTQPISGQAPEGYGTQPISGQAPEGYGTQPIIQQAPAYSQQQLQQQPGLRRRLDPGHHDSQRKGPEVARPYTPEQLDKLMNMLLEVAEKYHSEDVRLYHIMMGYYNNIREERMKMNPDELVKPPGGYY